MILTVDILKQIAPGGKKTKFKLFPQLVEYMNAWFPKFGIDTTAELCHILAQLAHESNSFNTLEEYASGKAYEGRKDLGNTVKGDGVRFKGRGPLQVTGRANYERMGQRLSQPNLFLASPQLLATPMYGIWSACIFWEDRDLNTFANMPDTAGIWVKKFGRNLSPIEYITWRVNGGFTHLNYRKAFYKRAKLLIK